MNHIISLLDCISQDEFIDCAGGFFVINGCMALLIIPIIWATENMLSRRDFKMIYLILVLVMFLFAGLLLIPSIGLIQVSLWAELNVKIYAYDSSLFVDWLPLTIVGIISWVLIKYLRRNDAERQQQVKSLVVKYHKIGFLTIGYVLSCLVQVYIQYRFLVVRTLEEYIAFCLITLFAVGCYGIYERFMLGRIDDSMEEY